MRLSQPQQITSEVCEASTSNVIRLYVRCREKLINASKKPFIDNKCIGVSVPPFICINKISPFLSLSLPVAYTSFSLFVPLPIHTFNQMYHSINVPLTIISDQYFIVFHIFLTRFQQKVICYQHVFGAYKFGKIA